MRSRQTVSFLGRLTLCSFGRHKGGSTAVEFAAICIPFSALIVFSLQLSIIYFASQGLETFTEDMSRNILTGTSQKAGLTQAQFKGQLCASLPALYSCSRLYVDIQTVSAFSSANTAPPVLTFDNAGNVTNNWQYQPGNSGDIVVVRMMYLWPVFGTIISAGLQNEVNGTRLIMATAVFKNEQYQ